ARLRRSSRRRLLRPRLRRLAAICSRRKETASDAAGLHPSVLRALGFSGESLREAADSAEEEPPHDGRAAGKRRSERPAPLDPCPGAFGLETDVRAVVPHRELRQPYVGKVPRGVVLDDLLAAAQRTEPEAADRA